MKRRRTAEDERNHTWFWWLCQYTKSMLQLPCMYTGAAERSSLCKNGMQPVY